MGIENRVRRCERILIRIARKWLPLTTGFFGSETSSEYILYQASLLPTQFNQLFSCLPCIEDRLAVLISQAWRNWNNSQRPLKGSRLWLNTTEEIIRHQLNTEENNLAILIFKNPHGVTRLCKLDIVLCRKVNMGEWWLPSSSVLTWGIFLGISWPDFTDVTSGDTCSKKQETVISLAWFLLVYVGSLANSETYKSTGSHPQAMSQARRVKCTFHEVYGVNTADAD